DRVGDVGPGGEPRRDLVRGGRAADQIDRRPGPGRAGADAGAAHTPVSVCQGARELDRGPRALYGTRARLRRLMEWQDTGFVLAARRHGESALIIELLTQEHGRHAGLVRRGQSPRWRAMLQPANEVAAVWRGRLEQHLGTIGCELMRANAARFLDDPGRLAGLTSAAALAVTTLPEREPHSDIYASFARLLA